MRAENRHEPRLQELGGAAAIIATAASGASTSPLVAGLAPRGQLVVVGAAFDPIEVQTSDLIFGSRSIGGSITGTPIQNEDNLAVSAAHGIAPMIEVLPVRGRPESLRAHDVRPRSCPAIRSPLPSITQ